MRKSLIRKGRGSGEACRYLFDCHGKMHPRVYFALNIERARHRERYTDRVTWRLLGTFEVEGGGLDENLVVEGVVIGEPHRVPVLYVQFGSAEGAMGLDDCDDIGRRRPQQRGAGRQANSSQAEAYQIGSAAHLDTTLRSIGAKIAMSRFCV